MDNPRYTAEGFGVDFSASVLATILAESIRAGRRETGGVLLGGYSEGLDVASVVEALGPPRDSRAGATWFHRGVAGINAALQDRWKRRTPTYYLGEWHFHPHASATPSSADLRQMREIASSGRYRCPEPILAVLGGDPEGLWTLNVVIVRREQGVLPLQLVANLEKSHADP